MEKKIGMGILYFFTMGLFGVGWMYDCVKYLVLAIRNTRPEAGKPMKEYERDTEVSAECAPAEIPQNHGFSIKKGLLSLLAVFLFIVALSYLPHISGILALFAAVLVAPIEKWQSVLSRFVRGKRKGILVTAVILLALFLTPADTDAPTMEAVEETKQETAVTTGPVAEAAAEPELAPSTEVVEISFEETPNCVGIGRTENLAFVLNPDHATTESLEVSVDHPEIAEVSLEKKDEHILQITGILPGEMTITLKAGDAVAAEKTIAVAEVLPGKITIAPLPQAPQIGSSGQFTVEFEPLDVTNQEISWESDDAEILQVGEDGSYEACAVGTATITATHKSGVVATIQIEVVPIAVETVTLSSNWEEGAPFCKNNSMTLIPEIDPEDAAEKSLTWYSSDETVATVSDEGVVTAGSPGTATITAEAANGITGTWEITVEPSPQTFRVSASISMKSNNHVGNRWTSGFQFNGEAISSGSTVSMMPGETFTVCGWAQDNDSKPDYGDYRESITLTEELCESGFTIEGEAYVYENGGRYSGNCAVWTVKFTFTPTN